MTALMEILRRQDFGGTQAKQIRMGGQWPEIAYCTIGHAAKMLMSEIVKDSMVAERHSGMAYIALDLETAPSEAEAERLKALVAERTALMDAIKTAKKVKAPAAEAEAEAEAERMWKAFTEGVVPMAEIKAAVKKAKAPAKSIEVLKAKAKLLATQITYAKSAALDPHRSGIRLASLYAGGDWVAVFDIFKIGPSALNLLRGLNVVIHNAGFDLICLEAAGVELGEVHCTMQAVRLVDGERAMGLVDAAETHLGTDLSKTEQMSDWSTSQLSPQQLEYAAKDVVTLWRLAEVIFPALGPQTSAYEIQVACVPAVARMRHRGILLDLDAHAAMMRSLAAKRIATCEAYKQACTDIGLRAGGQGSRDAGREADGAAGDAYRSGASAMEAD
jgi:ribonuclease D